MSGVDRLSSGLSLDVHEAKTHFSKLIARVNLGEVIIISKAGKPVARLMPLETPAQNRTFGTAKGAISVADDFDAPLPDSVLSEFYK